jgi:hypothetical protein
VQLDRCLHGCQLASPPGEALKNQVHPEWEYNGLQNPTRETSNNLRVNEVVKLLQEMFNNIKSWPTSKQVCSYHLRVERSQVRQYPLIDKFLLEYSFLYMQPHALYSFASTIPGFEGDASILAISILDRSQAPSQLTTHQQVLVLDLHELELANAKPQQLPLPRRNPGRP